MLAMPYWTVLHAASQAFPLRVLFFQRPHPSIPGSESTTAVRKLLGVVTWRRLPSRLLSRLLVLAFRILGSLPPSPLERELQRRGPLR